MAHTVTIRQVAERAGVSMMTVTRALRQSRKMDPVLKERVLQAVRDLGYRPNSSAQAFRSGRFGCVSLVLSDEPNRSNLPAPLIMGIQQELARHDLHLNLEVLPDEKLTSSQYVPKILRKLMTDGLLINYFQNIPGQLIELVQEHALPSIWLNSLQPSSCINFDERYAGRLATEHLLELGHRRIVFVDYSLSPHYSAQDRRAGYEAAMASAGLEPVVVVPDEQVPRDARARFAESLVARREFTAAVAGGETSALPLLTAALRMGVRVPRELSVVTFSHQRVGTMGFPMTSVVLPLQEMGRRAVAMLTERINSRGEPVECVTLRPALEMGESTAPPPAP